MNLENASREELVRIAELVHGTLESAGIACILGERSTDLPTANITIDATPGEGSVFIYWDLGTEHHRRVRACIDQGDFQNPAVREAGAMHQAGIDRVAAVLRNAGIETYDPENDFMPFSLEVVSVPGGA
jgi:ABC-type transport system substrate-binding protein